MKRIAVTGATGYIGGRLVPRLLDAGYAVRCLVRSPRKLQDRAWSGNRNVQVAQADLTDAQSLTESLTGCEAAFFLVHSMNSASAEYAKRAVRLSEELHINEDLSAFPKEVAIIGRLVNRGRPGGHYAPIRRRGMTTPQLLIMPRLEH